MFSCASATRRQPERPIVAYAAAGQRHQPAGHGRALLEVVRRKNDRLSFFRQTAKDSLQVSRRFRVQARERLVEQQELGLVEKPAGQRRPLLEAAGEPVHGLVGPVAQGPASLEKDLYPDLVARRELLAYVTRQRFYDIGTPERLALFEQVLRG